MSELFAAGGNEGYGACDDAERMVPMAENKELYSLTEVRAAVAALSPEDKELLDAVQASPRTNA